MYKSSVQYQKPRSGILKILQQFDFADLKLQEKNFRVKQKLFFTAAFSHLRKESDQKLQPKNVPTNSEVF